MFKSLKTVLFLSMAGLVLITISLFLIFALPSIRATVISQIEKDILVKSSAISGDFSRYLLSDKDRVFLQKEVEQAAKNSGNRITVIDKNGVVVADSEVGLKKLSSLDNHAKRPEVLKALGKGYGVSVRYSATAKKDLIYAATALKDAKGSTIGYLRFSAPLVYADEVFAKVYSGMLTAFFAAILVALVISFLLSEWFFAPLKKLSVLAGDIVNGLSPRPILRKSAFELGEIEASVEQISYKLSDYFEKLSDEKGKLTSLLANMQEGVLAIDPHGRIIISNPRIADIFNVSQPEIRGKTPREALRNNEISDIVEKIIGDHSASVTAEIETVIPVPSIFSVHAGPMKNEKNEFLGVICVIHDITKIKELERYRSEFVANVSHELKTPLTVIRNYVETLLNGAIDDKDNNKAFLAKIEKHSDSLAKLIDEILEISRLETGRVKKEFGRVDIGALILRCIDVVSDKAGEKGIKIDVDLAEGVFVRGIEDYVYRALLNIIDNAVAYTESDGRINIQCSRSDKYAEVKISDTGIGIPQESLSRIFERFYRVDSARSRDSGGTGLGLSIVKHVVELHDGRIDVESAPGKGSCFTLKLPLA